MNTRFTVLLAVSMATLFCGQPSLTAAEQSTISLPAPTQNSRVTVEQALQQRRSIRSYANEPITLQQVSQLLWAAQGITDTAKGLRTAPSAQGTYPLHVYLIAGNVSGLQKGAYEYIPQGHKLQLIATGDQRPNMGSQPQMVNAPVLVAYVVDYTNTATKYGDKAQKFAYMEIGHSAQNVLLEEVALGLIGVPMAGIDEAKMKTALKLQKNEEPAYLVSAAKKGPVTGSGSTTH